MFFIVVVFVFDIVCFYLLLLAFGFVASVAFGVASFGFWWLVWSWWLRFCFL